MFCSHSPDYNGWCRKYKKIHNDSIKRSTRPQVLQLRVERLLVDAGKPDFDSFHTKLVGQRYYFRSGSGQVERLLFVHPQ